MSENEDKQAVGDGAGSVDAGNYEVIRERLVAHGTTLRDAAEALNASRTNAFGSTELKVVAQGRVRTEHKCVARDILNVGGHLLFGYNVLIGMKQEVAVDDVLSLHGFAETPEGVDFPETDLGSAAGGFLVDPAFQKDFVDLYKYYRETRLEQIRTTATKLLAIFRYGQSDRDLRVFRWNRLPDGRYQYVDNRGEKDHTHAETHSFRWRETTRDDHVEGRHPHVSILDEVFVECVGGDLTIKVENNTEDGKGIYEEAVADRNQTLDDARIEYAKVGGLILLRIRPYNEEVWRHFVFNLRTQTVIRADAIGKACLELPEEHGVIFPDGYYLQSGDHKFFGGQLTDLVVHEHVRAPNGEDVLYIFYSPSEGRYLLLPYNLIRKEVQAQISCHGYSIFDDGRLVVFRGHATEPVTVHPMQVWQTPFVSADRAADAPTDDSFFSRIGNAELVRGISEALSIVRMIDNATPTRQLYEDLLRANRGMLDNFYWLESPEAQPIRTALLEVQRSAERIVDEFEKVVALRRRAATILDEAKALYVESVEHVLPDSLDSVDAFMSALAGLRTHRGHLITIRDTRYIDVAAVQRLEDATVERFDAVSHACIRFLRGPNALVGLITSLEEQLEQIPNIEKTADADGIRDRVDTIGSGLEVVSEVIATLEVEDPTARTEILEGISEVFAQVNRVRATLEGRRKELAQREDRAEFGAQFILFGQTVQSALALADTPERCDEQVSRLMLALEELEGRFSESDDYLADVAAKREEVVDAFDARKQTLLDARQRRVSNLASAAERILASVGRRARTFSDIDEMNAYFASDAMVLKLQQVSEQLRALGDSVKSDELASRLKSEKQDALRGLRDRAELFEDGANTIKLGRHRFSVNTQPLDLSVVPHDGGMALHLSGTDFFEPVDDAAFDETRQFWDQYLVSENAEVYRSEYLAATILFDAERGSGEASLSDLAQAATDPGEMLAIVRRVAGERYDEGYERGVHDADGARILSELLLLRQAAGLLRFTGDVRACALRFWSEFEDEERRDTWRRRALNLRRVRESFPENTARQTLAEEIAAVMSQEPNRVVDRASVYLVEELMKEQLGFEVSADANRLIDALYAHLDERVSRSEFEADLRTLALGSERDGMVRAWLAALVSSTDEAGALAHAVDEACAVLVSRGRVETTVNSAQLSVSVEGLLGQHSRIASQSLRLRLDEFLSRLHAYVDETVPAYKTYRARRHSIVEGERERLRLEEYKPRVMSSFVRNRLIDEVYLPIIGDNLAKQIGALGAAKRTDLMGLLLLVSPPGYGKTTLMEYVASRLGIVFLKVNGPSLGYGVRSLDPAEAPNATARQEVEKVNLALEMGNNVMLYLDDIQHTHPEFLQKFISLCDGTRRIEGVWRGRTKTYDLRGKKFVVVMAGNPYTEAGEKFQVPDMLANRADTYNLGDVLEGRDSQFSLSYVENALTSNSVLAPLAAREMADVYKIVEMAEGRGVAASELKTNTSAVELDEMTAVLRHMFAARDVLLRVNQEYIASAAQDDAYRTEPRFQLQGSYRNMNKIAEKIVPAMNAAELQALIDDHYQGEAQTLSTGAEQNLLKLAELRAKMTPEQGERWAQIKADFGRRKLMGGVDDDPIARVTGTLAGLVEGVGGIRQSIADAAIAARPVEVSDGPGPWVQPLMTKLDSIAAALSTPAPDIGQSIGPVLRNIDQRLASAYQRQKKRESEGSSMAPAVEMLARSLSEQSGARTPDELVRVLGRLSEALEGGLSVRQVSPSLVSAAARTAPDAGAVSAQTETVLAGMLERIDASLRLIAGQQSVLRSAVERGGIAAVPASPVDRRDREFVGPTPAASAPSEVTPLLSSVAKHLDEGRAVNQRMVELLDVLKLFIKHLHKLDLNG